MRTDRISTEAGGAVTGASLRLPSRTSWRCWSQMAAGSSEPTSDYSERWERRARRPVRPRRWENQPCPYFRSAVTWVLPSVMPSPIGYGSVTMRISAAMEGISGGAPDTAVPAGSMAIGRAPSSGCFVGGEEEILERARYSLC